MVNHLCYGTLSDEQPFSKLTGPCTESCHDYYADRLKDHMTAQHQMTDVCPIHQKNISYVSMTTLVSCTSQ
jgi:hypothetical protein